MQVRSLNNNNNRHLACPKHHGPKHLHKSSFQNKCTYFDNKHINAQRHTHVCQGHGTEAKVHVRAEKRGFHARSERTDSSMVDRNRGLVPSY